MRVGGMVEFRRSLAASFLFRFFLLSSYKLAADSETFKPAFPDTYKSAVKVRTSTGRPLSRPPMLSVSLWIRPAMSESEALAGLCAFQQQQT